MADKKIMKTFLILHIAILIYSMSTACGKFATEGELLSPGFIVWFALEIVFMGIYALVWQQVIGTLDLSVAYSNKSVSLVWTLLFSVLFFGNVVTPGKIIGILLAIAGTILMNTDRKGEEEA